ncbi:MAG: hypothetical protein ABI402_08275 [Ferruginibacter sp.]
MKKKLLIASSIAAGTIAFIYFFTRKNATKGATVLTSKRQHHRTEVFSNAKKTS